MVTGFWDYEYNTWDNGVEGNYWSDYTSRYHNATEVNGSGIWDVHFFINEVNIDRFPLTEPVDIEVATTLLLQSPDICISSPENRTYTNSWVSLNFTVNEATTWMGYSLDGQDNVTITENTLNLTELAEGSHTLTVYATDTAGNTGKAETIRFTIAKESEPEQPDQLNLILAGALICIATATVLGLLIYLKKRK